MQIKTNQKVSLTAFIAVMLALIGAVLAFGINPITARAATPATPNGTYQLGTFGTITLGYDSEYSSDIVIALNNHYTYSLDAYPGSGEFTLFMNAHDINICVNGFTSAVMENTLYISTTRELFLKAIFGSKPIPEKIHEIELDVNVYEGNNPAGSSYIMLYLDGVFPVPLPPDPVKDGYIFAGWYYDNALTQPYVMGDIIYADTDLYAKFTPISYGITYNLNGGTLSEQATSYNIESADYTLPAPSKDGYTFGGWFTTSSFGGSPVTTIPKGSTGNQTFYAKFVPITYSITYETNGGTLTGQTTSYTIESSAVVFPNPSKTGYTFNGWYDNSGFNGSSVASVPAGSTGNKTFYAKFTPITYAISYYLNGGVVSGQKTEYSVENDLYTLPTPTREGYTFDGWFTNSSFTDSAVTVVAAGSTGNKAFYAKWTVITYTVTFYVDGSVYQQISIAHGSAFSGYMFVNPQTMQTVPIYVNAEKTTAFDLMTAVYGDTILFAEAGYELYVTLVYSVGGAETETLLPYNSSLDNLREQSRDGYTFDGWFYDAAFSRPVLAADKLTTKTTVYAKFTEVVPPTFWQNAGAFFVSWWWAFVLPVAAIAVVLIVKKTRRN